jgi:exodeoxyribonuclease VII small subunit
VEPQGLSFEEAYQRLEEVVRRLESDDLTIDQSVELYENGVRLLRHCGARLDGAELRISQLAPIGDGELGVVPLATRE